MKTGVIADGINRDLARALTVMDEFGLQHVELQFIGQKEVGDHDASERRWIRNLVNAHGKTVSCISRHIFAGLRMDMARVGDDAHRRHMEALKRCIGFAQELDCRLVRIMTGKKEMILWGSHGAEIWNVADGAWDAQLALVAPAVELARREAVTLVVETGNGTMVNSCYTARRLIDDLDAKDVLKVLWDPANNCWCGEIAYPDAYAILRDGYIGHMHIKDVQADVPRATLAVRPLMQGQLAGQLQPLADALRRDRYDGVVSLESVYHAGDRDFEAGFRANISTFLELFASCSNA